MYSSSNTLFVQGLNVTAIVLLQFLSIVSYCCQCLRIKNMIKQEKKSSDKVLEEIKSLFSEASINIPDACIDCAHRVSEIDDTVMVRFTTFLHCTMFYTKRKELKNGVKVHLDLTKARLELLIKAIKYVKNLSNVDFVYANINCRLKIHFSNNNESFFDSMDDLISKLIKTLNL